MKKGLSLENALKQILQNADESPQLRNGKCKFCGKEFEYNYLPIIRPSQDHICKDCFEKEKLDLVDLKFFATRIDYDERMHHILCKPDLLSNAQYQQCLLFLRQQREEEGERKRLQTEERYISLASDLVSDALGPVTDAIMTKEDLIKVTAHLLKFIDNELAKNKYTGEVILS